MRVELSVPALVVVRHIKLHEIERIELTATLEPTTGGIQTYLTRRVILPAHGLFGDVSTHTNKLILFSLYDCTFIETDETGCGVGRPPNVAMTSWRRTTPSKSYA